MAVEASCFAAAFLQRHRKIDPCYRKDVWGHTWWDFGQKPSSISENTEDETLSSIMYHPGTEVEDKMHFKVLEWSSQSLKLNMDGDGSANFLATAPKPYSSWADLHKGTGPNKSSYCAIQESRTTCKISDSLKKTFLHHFIPFCSFWGLSWTSPQLIPNPCLWSRYTAKYLQNIKM